MQAYIQVKLKIWQYGSTPTKMANDILEAQMQISTTHQLFSSSSDMKKQTCISKYV